MAIVKVCQPLVRRGRGIYKGFVVVPGHQPERLRSDEERPSPKLPEEGFSNR
jgi:hypothetical protein